MAKPTKRDILRLRKAALDGMVSYMKYGAAESESDPNFDPDFDAGYTQADIDRCARIIDGFLASLEGLPKGKRNESILKLVKAADLPPFYGPGAVRVGSTVTDGSSGRRSAAESARGTIAPYSAGVRYPSAL